MFLNNFTIFKTLNIKKEHLSNELIRHLNPFPMNSSELLIHFLLLYLSKK